MPILAYSKLLKTEDHVHATNSMLRYSGGMIAKLKLKPYNVDNCYTRKWKPRWLQKTSSGDECCARKEKMMRWVFQIFAKDSSEQCDGKSVYNAISLYIFSCFSSQKYQLKLLLVKKKKKKITSKTRTIKNL